MTRAHILVLAAWLAGLATLPAAADQTDPRLDALFVELRETESEISAANAEREIWSIWLETDVPAAARATARGVRLLRLARHDAAEAAFGRAIAAAPAFAEAWNKRATVRFHQGDLAGAAADVRRTLALEPRHFGALAGLGMIFERRDRPARALASFEAALAINPHLDGVRARVRDLRRRVEGRPL